MVALLEGCSFQLRPFGRLLSYKSNNFKMLVYKSLIVFGGNLVTESLTKSAEFVFAN